jgi:hypothetical protein
MRIMGRPRALRGVTAVLALCLLVAGCGSGPSQVRAAAFLSGHEISVDQIQQLIDKAVQEQPAAQQLAQQHTLDQVGREAVRQLVLHDLVTRAAAREGLVTDPALATQLAATLDRPVSINDVDPSQLATAIVARVRDHGEYASDYLLERALGIKYFDKLAITFDYTTVSSDDGGNRRAKAFAKAAEFAASPDAAAKVVAADTGRGQEARAGMRFAAIQSPDLASTVLYGVPPGTVVTFEADPSQALWLVAVIRQRDTSVPVSVDQAATPTAGQLASLGIRLLQPYMNEADAKINPRYGVWDPVAMALAPSEAETTGLVLPVKGNVQP